MRLFHRVSAAISKDLVYDAPLPSLRHMRWLPILLLLMALFGFAMHVGGDEESAEWLWGPALLLTTFIRFRPFGNTLRREALDEREKLLRTRAFLAGANSVVFLALLGAAVFWNSDWLGSWKPMTDRDWVLILFTLMTVYGTVPALHASWTTQPIEEEEA